MRRASVFLACLLLAAAAWAAQPRLSEDDAGRTIPVLSPGTAQAVSYTATAAQSAAVGSTLVRVVCTTDCFYAVGADPTATSSDHFLPELTPYDLRVGTGQKLSFLQSSAAGTAYVTEWE